MDGMRRFNVAVLGSASALEDSSQGLKAFRVGELVALNRGILLTGGCPGLPHAAVRGAVSVGGTTVAVSPAANRAEHAGIFSYPLNGSIMVFTGMGAKGRNVILVRSSDACIFVGGGMGTLNEFTIAFDDLGSECAIGILVGSGGLVDEFARLASLSGKSPRASVIIESNPDALVEGIFRQLRKEKISA